MQTIETNYKPRQTGRSSPIHCIVGTERFLRLFEVSVCALRRRKDALYVELKKPGFAADKERVRELLTELDRICRAVRGLGAGYQLSGRNAHPDGLAGKFWQVGSQKGTGVDRLMRGMMCRSKILATSPDGDVAMANTRWGKAPSEVSERKIAYNRGKFKRADREPWLSLAAVRSECGGPAY